ncbi:MAG TPA: virulence RhuM family protein, partial [Anaerolineales bacterium]|nr:virulence RhuM family protein [Anaerolineales bacterium]
MTARILTQPGGEILLYQAEDGRTRIECRFEDNTLWLSQTLMADLFQTTIPNINLHIKNILSEGELTEAATIKDHLIVRSEGARQVRRPVKYYSLDMIIAVGYRVRSHRGTAFRQWATARLSEYLQKGFVLDDERLKNPPGPGVPDYFDDLLERIRDIRASEKRMYLQVRDIFALAADYRPDDAETLKFFQIIQNKLHWAATGKTAAELIAERADHTQPNMGLTSWKGAKVRKTDVTVAKNYLREKEIAELNRIVTMYLDYAEDQARRRNVLYMRDWREKLDAFLQFNERDILTDAGRVAKGVADRLALERYEQFDARRLTAEAQADERAFE